jgi:hypothetical protein
MIIREGHEIEPSSPLPQAGGAGGGRPTSSIGIADGEREPTPSPSRLREGGRKSVDLMAFANDHFFGRTTIVEVRTGTAIRGSSMLPGIGALGIGGAAPI